MSQRLSIGFLPLLDCAPLIAAAERGFAAAEGLTLALARETSWANIRDRVIVGQFEAAHMLGPMPLASALGIGHLTVPMVAPMALGSGGNAVTVSLEVWSDMKQHGARGGGDPRTQGSALREVIQARARHGKPLLTLATVYPFSCHNYALRYWLAACGIDPDADVRLVVMPPLFMVDALRENQIDGFSAGDPWNSMAVEQEVGSIVTATSAIWRHSPEKVLGMRADWAQKNPDSAAALIRSVYSAAQWCDKPESRSELAALLALPRYVGGTAAMLERALAGMLICESDGQPIHVPEFLLFAAQDATFPRDAHAAWFYSQMVRWKQVARYDEGAMQTARHTYRRDLYREALRPLRPTPPDPSTESDRLTGFFDGRNFDARNLPGYLAT